MIFGKHGGGAVGALAIVVVGLGACYQAFYPTQRKVVRRANHDEIFWINQGSHTAQSCDDCHGGLDSFTKFDCLSCHTHNPSDMARAHSSVAGYDYSSAQCLKCHPKGEALGRAEHEPYFPIAAGPHLAIGCTECHVDGYPEFSCVGCHEHSDAVISPPHSGVAGYRFAPTSCFECHPRGEVMSRAAHNSYFPIEGGRHGRTTCAECHPGGSGSLNCFDCHSHTCAAMSGEHDEVRSFRCDDRLCYQCHPRGYAEDD